MNLLKLFNLLKNFDGELIAALIGLATKVQDSLDGGLTREELDQLLTEVDSLADYSLTEVDDDLIQFVQRLVRDPFMISYVFDSVGFQANACEGCDSRPEKGCCKE